MLSTPQAGWSTLTLGDFTVGVSFLTDIPFDWLRACISGLKYVIPAAFFLDEEGSTCLITADTCETYVIRSADGPGLTRIEIGLKEIARSLVQDIRRDLEQWIWWCDAPLNEAQYANRKAMLLDLLHETEVCADNYMRGSGLNY